jgi:cytochrome c556
MVVEPARRSGHWRFIDKESPMKHWLVLSGVAALIAVAACNSSPQAPPAADNAIADAEAAAGNVLNGNAGPVDIAAVMHARHEHYEEMGDAMKAIGTQLKSGSPDLAVVRRNAATIAQYGPQVLTWFPQGSGPEAGKTRAKAEIWSDPQTFRQRAESFSTAAVAFEAAARNGDLAEIRAAHGELGNSCKNCHDRFRGPEQH